MGDRTYMQLTIYSCPPEKAGVVLDLLHEHGFSTDLVQTPGREDKGVLQLGVTYRIEEGYLGRFADELAPALIEAVPEIVFDGWEDPKYEWLGSGVMHTPDLGTFTYTADSDGNALFTADQVREAVAISEEDRTKQSGQDVVLVGPDRLAQLLGTQYDFSGYEARDLPRPPEDEGDE